MDVEFEVDADFTSVRVLAVERYWDVAAYRSEHFCLGWTLNPKDVGGCSCWRARIMRAKRQRNWRVRFARKMPRCVEIRCTREILSVHRAGKNQTGAQNQLQDHPGGFHVMPPWVGTLVPQPQHSDLCFAGYLTISGIAVEWFVELEVPVIVIV